MDFDLEESAASSGFRVSVSTPTPCGKENAPGSCVYCPPHPHPPTMELSWASENVLEHFAFSP